MGFLFWVGTGPTGVWGRGLCYRRVRKKSRFQVFQHSQPSTTQEVSAEALIRRQEATRFTYLLFTEHYSFKVRTSAEFL